MEKEVYSLNELLYYISDGNEDEQEAIKKYSELLHVLERTIISSQREEKIFAELKKEVREYISEEMKHSKGLSEFYSRLSRIEPED